MRFRKQKPEKPLVAGRDRASLASPSAPVYSYYGKRVSEANHSNFRLASPASTPVDKPRKQGRTLAQHSIVVACLVIALICLVKILFLVPNSKVVVTVDSAGQQLATERYAQLANKLMKDSVLNMTKITLNTNGIAREMEQAFPELASVVVAVPLIGNRPVVYVAPTRPAFVLETLQGQYTIDTKGYVLAKVAQPSTSLLRLREAVARTIQPGDRYFAGSTVTFASTVVYQLQQAGHTINYLDFPIASPYELDVYLTGKSYYLRFNVQGDAAQQSGGAIATLKQIGQDTPKQYLDMRTPERAYYR